MRACNSTKVRRNLACEEAAAMLDRLCAAASLYLYVLAAEVAVGFEAACLVLVVSNRLQLQQVLVDCLSTWLDG
jgi:hypothetical protein